MEIKLNPKIHCRYDYILVSSYSTVISVTPNIEECFLTRVSREIVEYINFLNAALIPNTTLNMKFDLHAITPLHVTVLQGSQPFYLFKNIVVWDKH